LTKTAHILDDTLMFIELGILNYNKAKIDSIAVASKKSYFYATLKAKPPM